MRYLIDSIITAYNVPKTEATHFAIYNGDKVRYYVAIKKNINKLASRRLSNNITSYSGKLDMIMKLVGRVPYDVFHSMNIGQFVQLDIDGQVEKAIDRVRREVLKTGMVYWNVIVGNYVEKQKVVFQCFDTNSVCPAVFLKVGGESSEQEIHNETNYLRNPIHSRSFDNPVFCFSEYRDSSNKYNIQATQEFFGGKVNPKLTSDIIKIYHDIGNSRPMVVENGIIKAFSHGDFTPWNMKKSDGGYIVFDWEYCGMRFYGFDLIHYLWQIENKLIHKSTDEAIQSAIHTAKKYDENLREISTQKLKTLYFTELKKQFGEVL